MKSLLIELKILCVKNQFRVLKSFVLSFCLVLVISLAGLSFVSLADVNDLMIGTGSNALMTMELDDSDYAVMPLSSLGTVSNTIEDSELTVYVALKNASGQLVNASTKAYKQSDGRFHFRFTAPEGMSIWYWDVQLYQGQLPSSGTYMFGYDFSSDFSYDLGSQTLFWLKFNKNAESQSGNIHGYYEFVSGDLFYSNCKLKITPVYLFSISTATSNSNLKDIGGSFAINFTRTEDTSGFVNVGPSSGESDYEYGVSDSLDGLSSSVDTMTDEISGVTEAIQNLQGAMEPHYSNVLTQLHHITEQLHAFYDQVYNNIHLPELSMLTQIKEAIENIDLQIEVDISEVKTAINNMSTAVQNKLQSTTDQITGGYDNSGIVSDQTELDSVLNEYQQAEDELFEDAKEHINNFEFDTPLDAYVKPLEDISYFLTGIYNGLGGLNIPIQFSLTLTIALILIGYYRIKR